MKKTLAITALTGALLTAASAQADVLTEGDNLVGGTLGFSFSAWNNAVTFGGSYERGIIDDIFPDFNLGVGAIGSYTSFSYLADASVSLTFVGAQANVHYDAGPGNVQPYGGITLGFNTLSWSNDDFGGTYGSGLSGGGQVGSRYYFNDNLAANVRLSSGTGSGFGYSVLAAGIDYRF